MRHVIIAGPCKVLVYDSAETASRFAFEEMLADRLLGNPTYNTERETQNLELLKTRQGHRMEEDMHTVLEDVRRQMVMIRK